MCCDPPIRGHQNAAVSTFEVLCQRACEPPSPQTYSPVVPLGLRSAADKTAYVVFMAGFLEDWGKPWQESGGASHTGCPEDAREAFAFTGAPLLLSHPVSAAP